MRLPEAVMLCIRRLEDAGFPAYAVGGCVRDSLLGLCPHDYDLCTQALPGDICRIFSDCSLVHSGEKHGTVGVVIDSTVYEITTFRTEGDYADSRHPGWVKFVPTIREDLARRDFTVNAMAYSPTRGYADPFGGRQDLEKGILRAVGDPETRFREDALRILRGVRFSARFRLSVEAATGSAMESCRGLIANLAPERVFDELCKLLPSVTADDLLTFAPMIAEAIPELAPCIGFEQHSPHHKYDVFTHIAHVVEHVPADLTLRWAALLHDIGKPATFTRDSTGRGHFKGHAEAGAQIAQAALMRLRAPTKLRETVLFLIRRHMTEWEPDRRLIRRRIGKYGAETVALLLTLQQADFDSKGLSLPPERSGIPEIQALYHQVLREDSCFTLRDLAVNGRDLLAAGFAPGPGLGDCLALLLRQVQDERVPNEKEALLALAADFRKP